MIFKTCDSYRLLFATTDDSFVFACDSRERERQLGPVFPRYGNCGDTIDY